METVSGILCQKQSRRLLTARPDETVLEATQRMNDHGVGALLIMDEDQLAGILTERDVLRKVVAEERKPSAVLVNEIMTSEVACCMRETLVGEVQDLMRQYRIRHVPVVDEQGEVQGILSIGDINAYFASQQDVTIHYLHEYLYGRV